MTLHDKALEYAAHHPTPHTGEPSWDQMCGNLIFRFGEHTTPGWAPTITGPNVWDVGVASGPRNIDQQAAPVGAFHWWRNRNQTGMPGHVGADTQGGGHTVLMATYAIQHPLGNAIGFNTVTGYTDVKPSMEYVGWTTNYAGAHLTTTPTPSEADMPIIAIEQNLTPDHPSYKMIGVGGTGRGWIEIGPNNRDYYDVLRGVLCHFARVINPNAPDVLPGIPAGVDATGWVVVSDAYKPVPAHETTGVATEIPATMTTTIPSSGVDGGINA